MRNRLFLCYSLHALAALGCGAESNRSPRRQVGILVGIPYFEETAAGFATEMRRLGYVEGEHIEYHMRLAYGGVEEERRMAEELVEAGQPAFGFSVMVRNGPTETQAARIAHKILEGTSPSDIPVESAETYFEINLNAIDQLGLTPSAGWLSLADSLIR